MSDYRGASFLKMSGSGNDFVVFDVRGQGTSTTIAPELVQALCARGTGVGADGVVLVRDSGSAAYGMRYFNADGTEAALCGNATLCAARLGVELGIVGGAEGQGEAGFRFETGVGETRARIVRGRPEIDLAPAQDLRPDVSGDVGLEAGERRAGFVVIGVPHVVILCDDADRAPVMVRGPALRRHPAFPHGANVNFVSRANGVWRYRTFERGVENETLACGTGAAACATLLREWGEAGSESEFRTSSGAVLGVRTADEPGTAPRLSGDARIVYRGQLAEI